MVCLEVLSSFERPNGSHLTLTSLNSLLLNVHVNLRNEVTTKSLTSRNGVAENRGATWERSKLTTHRSRRRTVPIVQDIRKVKARSRRCNKGTSLKATCRTSSSSHPVRITSQCRLCSSTSEGTNRLRHQVTRSDVELRVHRLLIAIMRSGVTHVEDLRHRAIHGLRGTDLVEHKFRVHSTNHRECKLLEGADLTSGSRVLA